MGAQKTFSSGSNLVLRMQISSLKRVKSAHRILDEWSEEEGWKQGRVVSR